MPRFHVLITDYAWPDVEIERRTLAEIDAELIVAEKSQQDAAGLAALAKQHQVDAIMTNWAKVPQAGDRRVAQVPHRLAAGDWPRQHRRGLLHQPAAFRSRTCRTIA